MTTQRYFLDTEFDEETDFNKIKFISMGLVDQNGREFYAISCEFNTAALSSWVQKNVVPHLSAKRLNITQFRLGLHQYFRESHAHTHPAPDRIEFWARNGSYDHVILSKMFGTHLRLSEFFAQYGVGHVDFRDIKELTRCMNKAEIPVQDKNKKHHALHDARYERDIFMLAVKRGLIAA